MVFLTFMSLLTATHAQPRDVSRYEQELRSLSDLNARIIEADEEFPFFLAVLDDLRTTCNERGQDPLKPKVCWRVNQPSPFDQLFLGDLSGQLVQADKKTWVYFAEKIEDVRLTGALRNLIDKAIVRSGTKRCRHDLGAT